MRDERSTSTSTSRSGSRTGPAVPRSGRRLAAAVAVGLLAGGAAAAESAGPPVVRVAAPVADRLLGGGPSRRTALEVRSVTTEKFGVGETKVHSYRARATVELAPTAAAVAPYAGLGVALQLVGGQSVEAVRGPGVGVGSLDIGAGANAFLGLRIPIRHGASVFAEGRAGLASDVGRVQRDRIRVDGRGDYTGFAGVRWAF